MNEKSTLINLFWNLAGQFLKIGSTALITLTLSWLLSPNDFGILAVVSILNAICYVIVNGGLVFAIIQKKNITDYDLSTAFFVNIFIALLIYSILFYIAPFIANFYEETKLTLVLRVSMISIFFHALTVVPNAILRKNMQFKKIVKISVPASIASGTLAVVLAIANFGVWALISQVIFMPLISVYFYYSDKHWLPEKKFQISSLKSLLSLSAYMLLFNLIKQISERVYLLVIGIVFSTATTGIYYFADRLRSVLISQLNASLQEVTLSAMARENKESRKLELYFKYLKSTSTLLTFIIFYIFIFSETLFSIFLDPKWSDAALYINYMVSTSVLISLNSMAINLNTTKEKTKQIFYLSIAEKVLLAFIVFYTMRYSIEAILLGELIITALSFISLLALTKFNFNVNLTYQLNKIIISIIPAFLSFLSTYTIINFLSLDTPFIELLSMSLVYSILFIVACTLTRNELFILIKLKLLTKFSK